MKHSSSSTDGVLTTEQRLKMLMNLPGNDKCCDCRAKGSSACYTIYIYMSILLNVYVCMYTISVMRSMFSASVDFNQSRGVIVSKM